MIFLSILYWIAVCIGIAVLAAGIATSFVCIWLCLSLYNAYTQRRPI